MEDVLFRPKSRGRRVRHQGGTLQLVLLGVGAGDPRKVVVVVCVVDGHGLVGLIAGRVAGKSSQRRPCYGRRGRRGGTRSSTRMCDLIHLIACMIGHSLEFVRNKMN